MTKRGLFHYIKHCHPLITEHSGFIGFEEDTTSLSVEKEIKERFNHLSESDFSLLKATKSNVTSIPKKNIAVLFSGGPAPGGHNVVTAIADYCENKHILYGVKNGLGGLLKGHLEPLSLNHCIPYINQGGFDLLGTDRTKINNQEQFNQIKKIVKQYTLNGLIIIGGDDSNTNAIFLANELKQYNCHVIGVPKTIDGDLRYPPYLKQPFGFDTATLLYAELVKNLIRDNKSTKKYWHFVKLMGRHAGFINHRVHHLAKPELSLYGEYISHHNLNFNAVITLILETIINRQKKGMHYGTICISEGLFEWIPEFKKLFSDFSKHNTIQQLPSDSLRFFKQLPSYIQEQLLLDTDQHGNIQLSRIETERCLLDIIKKELKNKKISFEGIPHFYGYEGRCATPSEFDKALCIHLGYIAMSLIDNNKTARIATCTDFNGSEALFGLPIATLLHFESRQNSLIPVIKKASLNIQSKLFP